MGIDQMKHTLILLGLLVLFIGKGDLSLAIAQSVPSTEAQQQFQSALEAFESNRYGEAYYGFLEVSDQKPLHQNTTASMMMAAKSLNRMGDYSSAITLLNDFIEQFPNSRYLVNAQDLIISSREQLDSIKREQEYIRLGLALPLTELSVTRSLFQGVQFAVDTYNQTSQRKVKILFRDTGMSSNSALVAVQSLTNENVSAIIGPLFSNQVDASASVTEPQQVVLMAPLATDTGITDGHQYVFQVNTTLPERGRAIARQAIDYLNLSQIGIVIEAQDDQSQEMMQGFVEELKAHGLVPHFVYEVQSMVDWARLPQLIPMDTLAGAEGIFFALNHTHETSASRRVQDAVNSVGQIGMRPFVLSSFPLKFLDLSRYGNTLSAYYVDAYYENERRLITQQFIHQFEEFYGGISPDQFAYVGYDVTEMLLQVLAMDGDLMDHLLNASLYDGVRMRIQFGEQRRNMGVYLFEHTPVGPQLIR